MAAGLDRLDFRMKSRLVVNKGHLDLLWQNFLLACQVIFISYEGSFSKLLPKFVFRVSILKKKKVPILGRTVGCNIERITTGKPVS